MNHDLDLTIRQWTKTRGPITAIGTWLRLEGRFRPCMVLIRAGSELDDRLIPCVILQERAWVWSEDIGDGAQAAQSTFQFAQILGFNSFDAKAIFFIASFIHDLLGDLLTIPPYQPVDTRSVAEATLINHTTGITTETEIREA